MSPKVKCHRRSDNKYDYNSLKNDRYISIIILFVLLTLIIFILIQQSKIFNILSFLDYNKISDYEDDARLNALNLLNNQINNKSVTSSNKFYIVRSKDDKEEKILGIDNYRNNCYLNAALQLIFSHINLIGKEQFFSFFYSKIDNSQVEIVDLLQNLYHLHYSTGINSLQITNFINALGLEVGQLDSPLVVIYKIYNSFMQNSNVFYNKDFSTDLLKISTCNSDSQSPLISFGYIDLDKNIESIGLTYYGIPYLGMQENFFTRSGNIVCNALIMRKSEFGNKNFLITLASENVHLSSFKNQKSMDKFLKNLSDLKQDDNPYLMFKNVGKISIPVSFEFEDSIYKYKASLLGWIESRNLHYVYNCVSGNSVYSINDGSVDKLLDINSNIISVMSPYITTYCIDRIVD